MTSPAQTRAIHALRRATGMEEADYRSHLRARFRVASSTALTDTQARQLIDELKGLAGQTANAAPSKDKATGPYAPVLQALWLAAFNLGLTRSRHDAAMMKFVERQTRVSHTRFLHDPALASKAIEGLKAWLARDGKVEWPAVKGDPVAAKAAVFDAIRRKCIATGTVENLEDMKNIMGTVLLAPKGPDERGAAYDALSNRLGGKLRRHLADQARRAA